MVLRVGTIEQQILNSDSKYPDLNIPLDGDPLRTLLEIVCKKAQNQDFPNFALAPLSPSSVLRFPSCNLRRGIVFIKFTVNLHFFCLRDGFGGSNGGCFKENGVIVETTTQYVDRRFNVGKRRSKSRYPRAVSAF